MFVAFGHPIEADRDLESDGYEWFLSLLPRDSRLSTPTIDSLLYHIRGQGFEAEHVLTVASACIFNGLVVQPRNYYFEYPTDIFHKPMTWEIIHNAAMTEHILSFLEMKLSGVRFMCHYNISEIMVEDDDVELMSVMRNLSRHPLSYQGNKFESEGNCGEETSKISDEKRNLQKSHLLGGGSLLGLDVEFLSKFLRMNRECGEYVDPFVPPADLVSCVKTLSDRMRCFAMDEDDIVQLAGLYLGSCRVSSFQVFDEEKDDISEGFFEKSFGKGTAVSTQEFDEMYSVAKIKIVDLGNACWTHKHFTDDIQTRQYRAPEVLLGAKYDTSTDMWSLACIVFELLTGDLLFDPHAGKSWDREEDHLAMMIELLGNFPRCVSSTGKHASKYFSKKGELKHIQNLKFWGLKEVFIDKYKFDPDESADIVDFMLPILEVRVFRQFFDFAHFSCADKSRKESFGAALFGSSLVV